MKSFKKVAALLGNKNAAGPHKKSSNSSKPAVKAIAKSASKKGDFRQGLRTGLLSGTTGVIGSYYGGKSIQGSGRMKKGHSTGLVASGAVTGGVTAGIAGASIYTALPGSVDEMVDSARNAAIGGAVLKGVGNYAAGKYGRRKGVKK